MRFIPSASNITTHFAPLDRLLVLRNSPTKVTQGDWYHYAEIGDINVATGGVSFHKMRGYQLPDNRPLIAKPGDVLISTVRTYRKGIGYVSCDAPNLVTTKAVMNVCGVTDYAPGLTLLYVYSFLRSDFFIEQIWSMLNRGLYPRMDKGALDKISIPVVSNPRLIGYVSALTQAIIEKEQVIQQRDAQINSLINEELQANQLQDSPFVHFHPRVDEIRRQGRLDAVIYDREYKEKLHQILQYTNGKKTPSEMGFKVTPGPSLEIKIIQTRIDSDLPKSGFYTLILPKHISEYGTMNAIKYLGTARKLPLLQQGDIVFGEAGFQKGRSIVLVEPYYNCTTNAHGLYARRSDNNLIKSIFFRCIFNWYRKMRLIDIMAVGGSGGHLSPSYFDNYIRIPKFPEDLQAAIAQLYHNPALPPPEALTLDTFVDWHHRWNASLGIWELSRELRRLQHTLTQVQEKIIEGKTVALPL